jgi:hypothetical protein
LGQKVNLFEVVDLILSKKEITQSSHLPDIRTANKCLKKGLQLASSRLNQLFVLVYQKGLLRQFRDLNSQQIFLKISL